jgi:ornithine decarboxylase
MLFSFCITFGKDLFSSGIKHFDVASIVEVKLINELFGDKVKMYFMHPIKSRESIKEAYFDFGIRDFSLDSFDELHKILDATNNAKDLGLHVRLSIPNSHSAIDLSGKFGILPSESVGLLRKVRASAQRLGICFHVGSQCMDPVEYRNAIMITKEVVENAKVSLDVLDVGGGFPSIYPGMTPPNLQSYFDEIFDSINQLNLNGKCKIWCEPGRALVAEAGSLVVRVEGRKNNMLYINDGTYGGLFDAGYPGFIYHTKAIRVAKKSALSSQKDAFGFYGPTCDSLDTMKGPFYLPENIGEGDYIEIGQLGAYSRSIRTEFNGFNKNIQIEVRDEPLESMYLNASSQEISNKFKF